MSETKDTRTEFQRMVDGEPYHYSEPTVKERADAGAEGCKKFNSLPSVERRAFSKTFFTCKPGADFGVAVPFFCEYVGDTHC